MGVKLLGKIKIHELAKELSLTSKEVIAKANELGIEAKTHMSAVEDSDAEKIRKAVSNKTVNVAEKPAEKTAKKAEKKDEKKYRKMYGKNK